MKVMGFMDREVLIYALAMQDALNANVFKGGWQDCGTKWLVGRAYEELDELKVEIACYPNELRNRDVLRESADVGNFCMMVADKECQLTREYLSKKAQGVLDKLAAVEASKEG